MGDATFTQNLLLPGNPTAALHAATKQYVDARPGANVTVSATAPASPGNGDLWVDTSTPTWTLLTLTNNWQNYGGGYPSACYHKDAAGFVHLRGLVRYGSGVIFTLPSGCRPTTSLQVMVSAYPGIAYFVVNSAGQGVVTAYLNGGNYNEVWLDNVSFATF